MSYQEENGTVVLRMKAADLFCKAGGASMGLARAGFEVTGFDIEPQPRYPFRFIQADALLSDLSGFGFVWASPPCQKFTIAGRTQRASGREYADLINATRHMLIQSGIPWAIENVPGAPVRPDFILCGSQFGLPIARHRLIECSFATGLTPSCQHVEDIITVCGHGTPQWMRQRRIKLGLHPNASVAVKKAAMGIDWMNRGELSQAVPPAYSQFIAEKFLAGLNQGNPEYTPYQVKP